MPAAKGKSSKKVAKAMPKFFSIKLLVIIALLAIIGVLIVHYSSASSNQIFTWNSRGVQHEVGSHTVFVDDKGVRHQMWSVTTTDIAGLTSIPSMWHGPFLKITSPGEPGHNQSRHDFVDIGFVTNTSQTSAYEPDVASVSVTGIPPGSHLTQSLGSGKLVGYGSAATYTSLQHVVIILPQKGTYKDVDVSITPDFPTATVSRLSIESETNWSTSSARKCGCSLPPSSRKSEMTCGSRGVSQRRSVAARVSRRTGFPM